MDAETWRRIEELFLRALELGADEQQALLAEAGRARPEVGREVAEMLAAHRGGTPLAIEERLLTSEGGDDSVVGSQIGSYRVGRLLGQGGMGRVYLAHRVDADYQQAVALKVVRPGYRAAELVDRFRTERQILASLSHPNIASLLDGGVAEDGRPYLVMQYVEGLQLGAYCDQHRLTIAQRLELFATVCRAVQFAHSKLVVHRDLKPSNILVTADGQPILLDFGIAKLLDSEAAGGGRTRPESRLVTPERAAPEQLRGEPVTAATDVYALGVLLFELLVGRLPHRFSSRRSSDIERVVSTTAPMRPVAALAASSAGDGEAEDPFAPRPIDEVCRLRSIRPERLRRLLRGDLEQIVLMALRREPERRYLSAGQLGEEVERFLRGEPVVARPDSLVYRSRKFVERHAVSVAAALAVALLLLVLAATATLQGRRVARERDRAEAERDRAEQAMQILVDLFETADPVEGAGGDQVPVGEFLREAEGRVSLLEGDPDTQSTLLHVLGRIFRARSDYEKAETLLRRALDLRTALQGEADPSAADSYHELALVVRKRGRLEEALEMLRSSLERQRSIHGESHGNVAVALQDLGESLPPPEGLAFLQQALEMRRQLGLPPQSVAASLNALGVYHAQMADVEAARESFEEALATLTEAHGEGHPIAPTLLGNLAATTRDPQKRESTARRLLELQMERFGRESEAVAGSWNQIGVALIEQGRLQDALEALGQSLEIWRGLVGEDHWRHANIARNYGRVLQLQRRYDEALRYLEQAQRVMVEQRGAENPGGTYIRGQVAVVRLYLGSPQEALGELAEVVAALRRSPNRSYLADSLLWQGLAHLELGHAPAAESSLSEALELRESLFENGHPKLAEARVALGLAVWGQARHQQGAALIESNLGAFESWGLADPELVKKAREAVARTSSASEDSDRC